MKTAAVAASSAALAFVASAAPCVAFSASSLKMSTQSGEIGEANTRRAFLTRAAITGAAGVASVTMPLSPALAAEDLPSTGTRAPSFDLPNSRSDGTTSLDSLAKTGKWTVLYFYPGAFTQGCTLEAKAFQRDVEKYQALNTQIVGVSVDPVEKNAAFCSKEGLDFYMLTDAGGIVSKKYGSALSVPGFGTFSNRQTYLIDPRGNLRWVFTDVESRVPRHSAEVLAKLEELIKA
eukprot:CAMPEP_0113553324 /NCGR_PEP_ID=MMETSP0015_2-20120614/15551_1 /TAXON_ID=2838 /ORGANISM="Odontella" /LENGTH=233 /DNA_ID=CAMNT_0000454383 /DNA_START=162 /DNA_END=863 /DNA_ORIENTATION=+ /assembly_acc=CAM_ASM_000160